MSSEIIDGYCGKTILISGARGYLGSALTRAFSRLDCKVILLDRSSGISWMPENPKANLSCVYGDVSRKETWEAALPGVDYVFHLAALEYDRSAFSVMEDLEINALAVLHLLEVCRINSFYPKIIFSSSANLFGSVDEWPVNENQRDKPPSLWSVHKLMAENYFSVYARQHGIKSVSLRLTNLYGPSPRGEVSKRVVINKIISRALAGELLTLYTNRNCLRDFIFIEDVVESFLHAGINKMILSEGDFYVIGSEEGITIKDMWQLIADKVKAYKGEELSIVFDDSVKLEPLDFRNFIADTMAFRRIAGWTPKVSLEQGIERTVKQLA